MSSNDKPFHNITQEQCSSGGKARAAKLSPERRKEIAVKAALSRKCNENIPKATHYGKLNIAGVEIACAVLENGKAVVTETSIFKLFGMQRGGRKKIGGAQMPRFLSQKCLQEYIGDELEGGPESFSIILPQNGGKSYAYEAEKIPDILKVYLDARRDGKLPDSMLHVAATAEIIIQALAKTGISALIFEATGYEKQKEKDELQKLFTKFIAQELQPWVKRFPDQFFDHLKRMYGLEGMKKNPKFFGCLINKFIYKELSPEIHEELNRLNPVTDGGYRRSRHHQLLTNDVGCPALDKQIQKVTTLLTVSDDMDMFEKLFEKNRERAR